MTRALDVYAAGLEDVMNGDASPLRVVLPDGSRFELPLRRWTGPLTLADEDVLSRAGGPVLDIGCGPGRHVHALARRGVMALGVDVSPVAVRLARQRGADALEGSIFDHVPGAASWQTALLLDGNVGIGGHPLRLLRRVRSLLACGGALLVEVDPRQRGVLQLDARLEGSAGCSEAFAWTRVGGDAISAVAGAAGFELAETWTIDGRSFARLAAIT
jgi:SAM-dependent methyltransferase